MPPPPPHHPKSPHLDPPPNRPSLNPPPSNAPPPLPPWGPSAHFYGGGVAYRSEETSPPCPIPIQLCVPLLHPSPVLVPRLSLHVT